MPVLQAETKTMELTESDGGRNAGLAGVAVVIPARQPDQRLVDLVEVLSGAGFGSVIVVNDGSTPDREPIFRALSAVDRVVVLHHRTNRGKGSALKTAFRHVLECRPTLSGVVTADADGQHTAEDVVHVAEVLCRAGTRPVLGVRNFRGDVPARSRWGNGLTRKVFAMVTGVSLEDTQTGLRGLPTATLARLVSLGGERYEYEMTMLAELCLAGPKPVQVPIATVYLDGNRSSHFRPVRDSVRVYAVLLRSFLCHRMARIGAFFSRRSPKQERWVESMDR